MMRTRMSLGIKLMPILLFACGLFLGSPSSVEAAWQPELLVGLSSQSSVKLSANTATVLQQMNQTKVIKKLPSGSTLTVTVNNGQVMLDGKKLAIATGQELELVVPDIRNLSGQITTINGKTYRGAVRLHVQKDRFTVINRVPIEEYLRGVVPEEMPSEWSKEALKAQAVAARTFALRQRRRHSAEGYDLCATTHCQQYSGVGAERSATSQIIDATRGEVLLYKEQPIEALFHTDSGGMTENSEDVWGSTIPYLRAAREVYSATQPWEKNITATDFSALLKKHGKSFGTLKKITLSPLPVVGKATDRTVSGRVRTVRLEGTSGHAQVSGNDLRSWLGLRSTMFQMTMRKGVVFISGYGWGHGLGLSQWGAKAFAETKHMSYAEILLHYYTGTTLKKLY